MVYSRDVAIPMRLKSMERRKKALVEYAKTSAEAARQASTQIFGIENGIKATNGYWSGLKDKEAMARIAAAEKDLRAKVAMDPKLDRGRGRELGEDRAGHEGGQGHGQGQPERGVRPTPRLLGYALSLVRIVDEEPLPSEKRLPEYSDANLKNQKTRLGIPAPTIRSRKRSCSPRGWKTPPGNSARSIAS